MEKNIKDFIHLYIGCEVSVQGEERKGFLTGITNGGEDCEIQYQLVDNPHHLEEEPEYAPIEDVKPHFRPLSDMTEEERMWWWNNSNNGRNEVFDEAEWVTELNGKPCEGHWTLWTGNIEYGRLGYTIGINNHFTQNQFVWLLKQGFDLFGLIESGLAIDKTKS